MKKDINTTRREFIIKAASATAGVIGMTALGTSCSARENATAAKGALLKASASTGTPVVVVARNPAIWNGNRLNADLVKKLLFKAMRKFTGSSDDTEAWASLFTGREKPGVKLNCIAGKILSSTPEVTAAIADGLLLTGVKPGDIICWDRQERELIRAGFTPGRDGAGVNYLATDSRGFGYENELTIAGEAGSLLSTIVTRHCDTLINVPVLKDHDLAGISGAMKNYFGAIQNPNKMHSNGCDPYVADVNTMPALRDKTRLIIYDATTAQYHGGPGYKPDYAWRFSGVIIATDPVAADTVAWKLIENKRREMGLASLEDQDRPPRYIASAAARGLGENRLDKIKIVEA